MAARKHTPQARARARARQRTAEDRAAVALREPFARNLAAARVALDLSQEELARRAGLSRLTIVHIESARADPRLATIAALARALHTTPLVLQLTRADLRALGGPSDRPSRTAARRSTPWLHPDRAEDIDTFHRSELTKIRVRAARIAATAAHNAGLPKGAVVASAIGAVIAGSTGAEIGARIGPILTR